MVRYLIELELARILYICFMKRNLSCDDKLIHQYQQNDQSPQIIEDKKEHDII